MMVPDMTIHGKYIICIWKLRKYYRWKAVWNGWPEQTAHVSTIGEPCTTFQEALLVARAWCDD
jgi:hypothetical protein